MINAFFVQQIKSNLTFQPTSGQEQALNALADFMLSTQPDSLFLLKGYAGTGKTSLVGALVKTLDALQQKVVLLAPTGRAAKVFSRSAGHPAYTIHKKITVSGRSPTAPTTSHCPTTSISIRSSWSMNPR